MYNPTSIIFICLVFLARNISAYQCQNQQECGQAGYLVSTGGTVYTVYGTWNAISPTDTRGFPHGFTLAPAPTTTSTLPPDGYVPAGVSYHAFTTTVFTTVITTVTINIQASTTVSYPPITSTLYFTTIGTTTVTVGQAITNFPAFPTGCPSDFFWGRDSGTCVYCPDGFSQGEREYGCYPNNPNLPATCGAGFMPNPTATMTGNGGYASDPCIPITLPVVPVYPCTYDIGGKGTNTDCIPQTTAVPLVSYSWTGSTALVYVDGMTLTEAPGYLPTGVTGTPSSTTILPIMAAVSWVSASASAEPSGNAAVPGGGRGRGELGVVKGVVVVFVAGMVGLLVVL